jgi:hypothetical protein
MTYRTYPKLCQNNRPTYIITLAPRLLLAYRRSVHTNSKMSLHYSRKSLQGFKTETERLLDEPLKSELPGSKIKLQVAFMAPAGALIAV